MLTSVLNRTNSFFTSINVCCRIRNSDGSENKVNLFNTCLYLLFFPANLKVRGLKPNYLTMWQLLIYNDQPNVGIIVQSVCCFREQPCPLSFVFHFLSHYCCQPRPQRVSLRKSEKPWGAGTVANLCLRPHAAVHILSELSTCILVSWSIALTWSSSLSEPGSANCRWPEVVASRGRLGWKLKFQNIQI